MIAMAITVEILEAFLDPTSHHNQLSDLRAGRAVGVRNPRNATEFCLCVLFCSLQVYSALGEISLRAILSRASPRVRRDTVG